jgi:hypothetical protein
MPRSKRAKELGKTKMPHTEFLNLGSKDCKWSSDETWEDLEPQQGKKLHVCLHRLLTENEHFPQLWITHNSWQFCNFVININSRFSYKITVAA